MNRGTSFCAAAKHDRGGQTVLCLTTVFLQPESNSFVSHYGLPTTRRAGQAAVCLTTVFLQPDAGVKQFCVYLRSSNNQTCWSSSCVFDYGLPTARRGGQTVCVYLRSSNNQTYGSNSFVSFYGLPTTRRAGQTVLCPTTHSQPPDTADRTG